MVKSMYTFKVRIHPNNKQATKIRRTMNKCVECQNMVYDYIDSFVKQGINIPSCADVRKWFTVQKAINDTLENKIMKAYIKVS